MEPTAPTPAPSRPRSERGGMLRAAVAMSIITGLSRVLGLVRETLRAAYLGTGAASDAFGVAFQLPNLLRRFMGEGAMSAGFVPVFARAQQDADPDSIKNLANRSINVLTLVGSITVVLGIVAAPWIIDSYEWLGRIGADQVQVDPELRALTVSLTRWMFPYLLFVSLAALVQGILNTYNIYWVSAFSSVVLNLSFIVIAYLFARQAPSEQYGAYVFAAAVLVGGVLQLAVQLPSAHALGFRWRPSFDYRDPRIFEMARLLGPATISAGIYQINVLVSQAIAYTLPQGSVSSLQYSSRLMELTLGGFVVSVATVILPGLSKEAGRGDLHSMRDTMSYALRLNAFVCLPATFGLLALRSPIVSVLFERGAFDEKSLAMTIQALTWHAPGLLFIAVGRALVPVFYALKDTRRPMVAAGYSMLANILLCYLLRGPLAHGGIAFANSASALVTATLLLWWLRPALEHLNFRAWLPSTLRALLASVLMAALLAATDHYLIDFATIRGTRGAPLLALLILPCIPLYAGLVHLLGGTEPREFLTMLRRRRARRAA